MQWSALQARVHSGKSATEVVDELTRSPVVPPSVAARELSRLLSQHQEASVSASSTTNNTTTNNTTARHTPAFTAHVLIDDALEPSFEPSRAEVADYATHVLGLDLNDSLDARLLWVARRALTHPLPPDWRACTRYGTLYFWHVPTGRCTFEDPGDAYYRALAQSEREAARAPNAHGGAFAASAAADHSTQQKDTASTRPHFGHHECK